VKDYAELGKEIGELVTEKQAAYGDAFGRAGEVLRILYPGGVSPDGYRDLLTVTRVLDKLFRIATDRDALGESPWRDVAGYALLATMATEEEKESSEDVVVKPATHFNLSGSGYFEACTLADYPYRSATTVHTDPCGYDASLKADYPYRSATTVHQDDD